MKFAIRLAATLSVAALLSACGTNETDTKDKKAGSGEAEEAAFDRDPYPSTYKAYPSDAVLLRDATVYDGLGNVYENYDVLLQDGNIANMGEDLEAGDDTEVVDASGKFVTPGIIDNHSHLGVYPSPSVSGLQDGNEISAPVTAEVWAEHGIWPQDPGFTRALAGGVTSLQILPGSANLFGGRGVTLKNVLSRTVQGMKFPEAPYTLKMACGENPKRVYGYGGGRFPGGAPYSRMGNVAGYRGSWIEAQAYDQKWDSWEEEGGDMPTRNLELDTLRGVLDGDILVHMHCYRADEMAQVIDMSKEFGYKVTSFHHAVESYKIADKLAEEGICSSMWADWWGFKMEAYDGIRENIPMVHKAGACAIVHSDSDIGIQRLNQEAAKALADGRRAGIDISDAEAWTWLSANPAKSLGIFDQTGSLETGKDADVVLWTGNPFSTYSNAERVYIDGALMFDLERPDYTPVTDFELGQPGEGDVK
ncbi:MAG: amidohydrolase [Henriciella sp.]|jgi:imidazolonepropionase-like amidohydrolase|uniref:amidohydrolase n=1 Tax=Henriciella sp. TaxID=1968823 RepID=UPI000C0D0318|nr:amidohydrolase [Henriciella sp.]MAN73891.1 amidohydrolase [Henriciella sp.]MBF34061.1 amidohydrolase [Hyphomonadaceae bacterium]PHR81745.1 MAG: amidohydrolase [Henriciella sp.]|tara:strand:+ start:51439 stop:52869 length:1431 start_codon:yes stop_codon:yes gene_type:complete